MRKFKLFWFCAIFFVKVIRITWRGHQNYHLEIVRVRPFNHIGPRQAPDFICLSFAKQIVEIERGLKEPVIKVGNLEEKRDFTDVRYMVRAY